MSEENGNGERLARVETELESIKTLLQRLDTKFDLLNTAYVPRNEINIMFEQRDRDIQDLEKELDKAKQEAQERASQKQNLLPVWIGVVISAAALGVAIIAILAA